jgi:small subunit ribosomal protein S1
MPDTLDEQATSPETTKPETPSSQTLTDDTSEESFAQMLRENDLARAAAVDRSSGSKQIDATVVAVSDDTVFLDIGYKTEGILPLSSFGADEKAVEPGDTFRVTVKGRDLDGYYELTRQKTAVVKDYSSLEEAFEAKGIVAGTVTGVVKGGLTVDIGMRAFLPASRSATRDAAEMAALVGEEIRVRITALDLEGGESGRPDAVVDRRSVVEEEARAHLDRRYSELAEGQTVEGTVRSLTDYGAFVDLGGADALLHISDLAWHRVGNPAEILTVGQTIEAKILKIDQSDPARRKIAIGLKQLQPHPWDTVAERFALGDKVTGTVTRNTDFGSFVEVAPGVEGLIHISEMAWGKKVRKPSDVVKVGDTVEAVVLALNTEDKRLSLGLKQALGDPWVEVEKNLRPGSVVEGPVSRLAAFGAFVTVAEGVEGLIHISENVPDKRLNHPSEALRVGQVVKAQVLGIDNEKRQLKLSIKQLAPTGLDEFLAEHKQGDTVTGRIIDIDHVGNVARVELGEGIVSFCPVPPMAVAMDGPTPTATGPVDLSALGSMLSAKWKTEVSPKKGPPKPVSPKTEELKSGQVRSFRIAVLEPETKKIGLELV